MKEFMDNAFSVNMPSLSGMEIYVYGPSTISWWVEKYLVNNMSQVSTLYIIALVSYDSLFKRL